MKKRFFGWREIQTRKTRAGISYYFVVIPTKLAEELVEKGYDELGFLRDKNGLKLLTSREKGGYEG